MGNLSNSISITKINKSHPSQISNFIDSSTKSYLSSCLFTGKFSTRVRTIHFNTKKNIKPKEMYIQLIYIIKKFILFFLVTIIFSRHQIHQRRDIEQSNKKRYNKSSDKSYCHRSKELIFDRKNKQSDNSCYLGQKDRNKSLSYTLLETINNRKSFFLIIIFKILQMYQCLIYSDSHNSKDSYHCRKC